MAENLIYSGSELAFSLNTDPLCFLYSIAPPPFTLAPDENYRVVWDGVSYDVTTIDTGALIPGSAAMGNGVAFGFPGNGEPFIILYSGLDVAFISTVDTAPQSHSVEVYKVVEEEETPDKEYLIWGSTLKAIGDAIREKTGKQGELTPSMMPTAIASITGGGSGGNAEDVRYVTFMSQDGSVEYGKKAVAVGDDCADPIARGIFSTPTKENTAQYSYTFAGWSTTANGGLDANALKAVTEDRVVYANFAAVVNYYTIRYYDGETLLKTESLAYGAMPSYAPKKDGYTFLGWTPEATAVTGNVDYSARWEERITFANGSWAQIAQISESGRAADYFKVGDTKEIVWGGYTYTLAILGFDHDDLADGSGKAGMTIGFLNSTPDKIAAISNQQNTYICWGHSYCRVYTTIVGYLNQADLAEIKAVAKPVFKYSYREIDNKNQKTTDTFFALSSTEVGGSTVTTGSKYAYFTDANKRKMLNVSTGSYAGYLLRDAAITSSYKYWYFVESSGTVGSYAPAATSNYYPLFAFCV